MIQIVTEKYTLPQVPDKNGNWSCKIKDPATKTGYKSFKAKTKEELKAKIYYHQKGISKNIRRTFADVFEIVQRRYVDGIRDPQKLTQKQNSVERHWQTFNRYIKGTAFESRYIDEITPPREIMTLCERCVEEFNLKRHELTSLRSCIRSAFALAESMGWIPDGQKNAYDRSDFRRSLNLLREDLDISERTYSNDEIARIARAISEHHRRKPDYLPAYALELQFLLGLRRGEVPALKWSDIENGVITIRRMQRTVKVYGQKGVTYQVVDSTKTAKTRRIAVTNRVQGVLDRIREIHDLRGIKSGFLFSASDSDSDECISNAVVPQLFSRICKSEGIVVSKELIRGTHAFRRNFSTDVANVSSIEDVSMMLGHTPQVDRRSYNNGMEAERMKLILEAAGR